jgi:hypothetical protein
MASVLWESRDGSTRARYAFTIFVTTAVHPFEEIPTLYDAISRVALAVRRFEPGSGDKFRARRDRSYGNGRRLAGPSFYARLNRRGGARQDLRSTDIEKFLDDEILAATSAVGGPAKNLPSRTRTR